MREQIKVIDLGVNEISEPYFVIKGRVSVEEYFKFIDEFEKNFVKNLVSSIMKLIVMKL